MSLVKLKDNEMDKDYYKSKIDGLNSLLEDLEEHLKKYKKYYGDAADNVYYITDTDDESITMEGTEDPGCGCCSWINHAITIKIADLIDTSRLDKKIARKKKK
ncbi:hypothetical protein DRO61_09965 [Candidatus Bathyarchaeota archaeon]|nr:MAG: hypothetical protein DRO61_09965 [Candidatus Bathyarchaeota archaeon]